MALHFYEAAETVQQQALNIQRIAQRQANAELDLGPGIYLTESPSIAAAFAQYHGVYGRGGGPSILVIEIRNGQWWWLCLRHGAIDRQPISNMIGNQSFVPIKGAEAFNGFAVFSLGS